MTRNAIADLGVHTIDVGRFREQLHRLSERTPYSFPVASVPRHFRQAAVLLPFWEESGDICVALIRRAESLRVHPGEVAFAGGIVDPGESFTEAAVREAHEEIDLEPPLFTFSVEKDTTSQHGKINRDNFSGDPVVPFYLGLEDCKFFSVAACENEIQSSGGKLS